MPADKPPAGRQYPHVDGITDWRAQQTIRLLWDRVFALDARLSEVTATTGDLVSRVDGHDDALKKNKTLAGEALAQAALANRSGDDGGDGGGGGGGGGGTMPNYGAIVQSTLDGFGAGANIIPVADTEAGKAQLTRAAAWAIYAVDPRVRLLEKTGGTQINGRSTDIILQGTDGSFADVASEHDNGDGTVTIRAGWGGHRPDKNTSDETRWIVPTATIAAEPGPM